MKKYLWTCLLALVLFLPASTAMDAEDMEKYQAQLTASQVAELPKPEKVTYFNMLDGYKIDLPGDWIVDDAYKGTVTRVTAPDQNAVIKIYVQPLNGVTAGDYVQYSNQKVLQQRYGMRLWAQNWNPVNGIPAYRIMWERPRLNNVANDLNLYREINLLYSDQIFTFVMKTDIENYGRYSTVFESILGSFLIQPVVPENKPAPVPVIEDINLDGPRLHVTIPKDQMMWGIFHPLFHPNVFNPQSIAAYKQYEQSLDHKFEFVMTYTEFYKPFPSKLVADTYADGRMMMLTLAPTIDQDLTSVIIPAIANGEYDAYIAGWAQQVKNVGDPVFVRFANEMNGDWDPWCAWFYSKDPDLYIAAWQRMYNIFKQQGADNAIFVWNPHDRSFPDFKWNSAELYYPGDQYVDWVGLTGYNNGTGFADEYWRNFNDIYRPLYNDYLHKFPGKPFMITEFSCSELGGDKAAWINDCMHSLAAYPNIRIAVWYDQTDRSRFYRIDSSSTAKEAFRRGLTNPYFL